MTHIQLQYQKKKEKNLSYVPYYMHTSHIKHIVQAHFNVCTNIATIQCLNYRRQESEKEFVAYDSDTPVTFKQGQHHQTWSELLDPKQSYNHEELRKTSLKLCPWKSQCWSFLSNQKVYQKVDMCEYVWK